MKTIQDLEDELLDWVKCIQFETDRNALKWYLVAYVETWLELRDNYEAVVYQLN